MDTLQERLRFLPSVGDLLSSETARAALRDHPRAWVFRSARRAVEELRAELSAGRGVDGASRESLTAAALARLSGHLAAIARPRFRRVINATGVVIHTNLGRAPLAPEVARRVMEIATSYSNLEYDLTRGARGSRHDLVAEILADLAGAEAACVVNNNAAAVFLALRALAAGREVVVSRGELVEIGGSFRIPDIMAASGAHLVEVGTTNKTHPHDYEAAIRPETALLLKVHSSNFRMVGFTAEVSPADLAAIGRERGVPVMMDLGSGCLVPMDEWVPDPEPTAAAILAAGVDLVTFSGDKMLGGPQAGIILGRTDPVARIRRDPLMRMVRPDKMTLAALEATLRLYADPEEARRSVPALAMMTRDAEDLAAAAGRLAERIRAALPEGLRARTRIEIAPGASRVGGGAMPLAALPTSVVAIEDPALSAQTLAARLRDGDPPVVARIEDDRLLVDPRTLLPGDEEDVVRRLAEVLAA